MDVRPTAIPATPTDARGRVKERVSCSVSTAASEKGGDVPPAVPARKSTSGRESDEKEKSGMSSFRYKYG